MSLSDWWLSTGLILDVSTFVSAPSSLFTYNSPFPYGYAISKHPLCQNLKAGMVITYVLGTSYLGNPHKVFIGVQNHDPATAKIIASFGSNEWKRASVRWWQTFNLLNQLSTAYQTAYETFGAWAWSGVTYTDPLAGDENQVGVGRDTSFGQIDGSHLDDTEIWTP
jgi:hypothetical protein